MMSEAEEEVSTPRHPFQDLLARAKAGIAAVNEAADASAEKSLRRLREIFSALAILDGPWWLLLCVPGLLWLDTTPASAALSTTMILAAAVALAGRRWGSAALTPTLLICLLELVRFSWLPGFGDLATIPVLLVAARIGYDPGFLGALQRCTALRGIDYVLLTALILVNYWHIIVFNPDFDVSADAGSILKLIFLLLGASRVSRRAWLLLLGGFAVQLLMAPLDWSGPFVSWGFGLPAVECLTCIVLFEAGRMVRDRGSAETSYGPWLQLMRVGFLALAFMFAAFEVWLQYPSIGLELDGTRATSFSNALGSPAMVAALAVCFWRSASGPRRGRLALVALMLLGVTAALESLGLKFPQQSGSGLALFVKGPDQTPISNAVVLLALCAIMIYLVERWQPRIVHPAPQISGSFTITLLGRFWSATTLLQSLFLLAVAGTIALLAPLPRLENLSKVTELDRNFSDTDGAMIYNVGSDFNNYSEYVATNAM